MYLNNMRLGNTFCLWCGAGPMPLWCQGKKCIPLSKLKFVDLPKPIWTAKRHVGLCRNIIIFFLAVNALEGAPIVVAATKVINAPITMSVVALNTHPQMELRNGLLYNDRW